MPRDYQPFELGLSDSDERRADALHKNSLIIDALYQGPIGPRSFSEPLLEFMSQTDHGNPGSIEDYFKLRAYPLRLAADERNREAEVRWRMSGLTGGNREVEFSSYEMFADLFGLAHLQFETLDWVIKATKADDFRRAKEEHKFAGFITSQMVTGPFPSLSVLESAWELGLRMCQLTYNEANTLGCGCTEAENSGLTQFGREAIALMNECGVIVDTSHSGEKTTQEACSVSKAPVVASHTMARSLHEHDRAKTDDTLRAIAGTGGFVGIVAVPFFLSEKPNVSLNEFLDHVDYIVDLVGSSYVCLGTDWPNQLPFSIMEASFKQITKGVGFKERHGVDPVAVVEGFQDYSELKNITRGLVARGYQDEEIQAILGGNILRVFEQVCG